MTLNNNSICDTGDISAEVGDYGIVTSSNYPNWEPSVNCGKRIVTFSGNLIRLYFTDINIDQKDSQTFEYNLFKQK